jgi:hypothetical protein
MTNKPRSKKHIILVVWPFLLALIVFISVKTAVKHSGFVEVYYSQKFYPVIARLFSSFSHLFRFSLWDIFWFILILSLLCGLLLVIFKKIKPGWYFLKILQVIAFLYAFFYISWGFNYFRPGIDKRLTWTRVSDKQEIFRTVIDSIVAITNRNYILITPADYKTIDSIVEQSYSKNSNSIGISYPNGIRRPKKMIFSQFFSKVGVSGYFGPFFNEIHINGKLMPMDYPFVLSHEKAHQFGVTSEAEANFVAYVICINSDDQKLRYSGCQSLLLYFLRDATHRKDYHEIFDKIDKKVIDDLRTRQKYYLGLQNENMSDMQTAANNAYLKVNNIEKGVKNYDQVVTLVLEWYQNKVSVSKRTEKETDGI